MKLTKADKNILRQIVSEVKSGAYLTKQQHTLAYELMWLELQLIRLCKMPSNRSILILGYLCSCTDADFDYKQWTKL
jgi:hypothetical protein